MMFLLWIIALILAIPTYGISLLVAFIIGVFHMKFEEDNLREQYKSDMVFDDSFYRTLKREVELKGVNITMTDYMFKDLTATVCAEVALRIPHYDATTKFAIMVTLVATSVPYYQGNYELEFLNVDIKDARHKTQVFMFNFFKNAEYTGMKVRW